MGGCRQQCINRADELTTWLRLCSDCVDDRDRDALQEEITERLHPELRLLSIALEDDRDRLADLSHWRSGSLSGESGMTERDRVPDGQMPGTRSGNGADATASVGAVDASGSPECRERSEASDRPRSGEGGSARDSVTAVSDGGYQMTVWVQRLILLSPLRSPTEATDEEVRSAIETAESGDHR
ncbi:hypothetical protein DVR14_08420 [Natrinema thermotolerans]|nr:hypothetical protein DVR14_08420 [Natrinema thermotolerans]